MKYCFYVIFEKICKNDLEKFHGRAVGEGAAFVLAAGETVKKCRKTAQLF